MAFPPDEARSRALLEIVRVLASELRTGFDASFLIGLDAKLDRDLGLDSLARVELVARIERAFGVRLREDAALGADTVGDLLQALEAAAPAGSGAPAAAPLPALARAEAAPYSVTSLVEALQWHTRSHPDRAHVILIDAETETERLTYGALEARSLTVAGALRDRGIRAGDAVALMLPNDASFLCSFFGVLLAGATPVPLYPPARPSQLEDHLRRQARILANCRARLLVAFAPALGIGRALRMHVPTLRGVASSRELLGSAAPLGEPVEAAPTALLQYTSGSTGDPKGVVLTHANLLANIRAMGRAIRVSSSDVFVSWLPLYHDMGLIGAWLGSLYYGLPLVLMSPATFLARPHTWLRAIHRYRGTLSGGPNFAYELCAKRAAREDLSELDLGSWRFAFNGAEPVSADTIARFCERFGAQGFDKRAMAPVYGLAECAVGLTFPSLGSGPSVDRVDRPTFMHSGRAVPAPDGGAALAFVGCGVSLEGHRLRIVDAAGRALPERQEGRIEFSGPSATSGYFANEEATRRLFDGEWLDTGDLGYIADAQLYPTSRVKDIIIRGGRHLHPYELEEAVGRLPGVRQGCVAAFGSPDPDRGTERLVVLAESREPDRLRREALRAQINALAVELLEAPADVVELTPPHTLLKTSSGKLRRAEIRSLYERGLLQAGPHARLAQLALFVWDAVRTRLRRWLRVAAAAVYGACAWTLFLAVGALTVLLLVSLPWPSARARVVRYGARLFLACVGLRPSVEGAERLPPRRPFVLVANHSSYLDSIVLVAALPIPLRFVAKKELARSALAGFVLRSLGAIFVERAEPGRAGAGCAASRAGAGEGNAAGRFSRRHFCSRARLAFFSPRRLPGGGSGRSARRSCNTPGHARGPARRKLAAAPRADFGHHCAAAATSGSANGERFFPRRRAPRPGTRTYPPAKRRTGRRLALREQGPQRLA